MAVSLESAEVEALIVSLGLERGSCGYMAKTFDSDLLVSPNGRPTRPVGSCLYFLVTAHAPISPHRIWSDQVYHHYAGAPLDVLLIDNDGSVSEHRVSAAVDEGSYPQLLIPAGTYHLGRVSGPDSWALLGTSSWPAVAASEVEPISIEELAARYPAARSFPHGR
jgi:predicted cupin superfamily sugar epimerase